jgi:hypothetical protein
MQPLFKMFGNVQLVQELTSQDEKKNRTAFLDLQTQSATSKVRKSRYTVRHYRRQPSISFKRNHITNKTNNTPEEESNENNGIKSQKLLCLWPLPIVTRYMILVSLLVTAVDRLFGAFACSAPSFVLYRWDVMNLVASPFLIHQDLSGYFLFCWNVLILGLFEESVAPMVGGTKKFIQLLSTLFALVSVSRVVMGFIFSKSTGWAFPLLFFSNAMHECNKGKVYCFVYDFRVVFLI